MKLNPSSRYHIVPISPVVFYIAVIFLIPPICIGWSGISCSQSGFLNCYWLLSLDWNLSWIYQPSNWRVWFNFTNSQFFSSMLQPRWLLFWEIYQFIRYSLSMFLTFPLFLVRVENSTVLFHRNLSIFVVSIVSFGTITVWYRWFIADESIFVN